MELAEKNGQQSMEEILASIRRIIAEEPNEGAKIIDLTGRDATAGLDFTSEDGADFELPSMFRPVAQAPAERVTPLFGRLTDAIRGASTSQSTGHTLTAQSLPAQSVSEPRNGRLNPIFGNLLEQAPSHAGRLESRQEESEFRMPNSYANGLSALHLVRREQPVADVEPSSSFGAAPGTPYSMEAVSPPIDNNTQMPRQMAAFKDTRFCKMTSPQTATGYESHPQSLSAAFEHAFPGEASSAENSDTLAAAVAEVLNAAEYEQRFDAPHDGLDISAVYPAFADPAVHAVSSTVPDHAAVTPPPLDHHAQANGIEDQTADLLRPMLRQWLADNMPKMVEKALHIEVSESVKSGKKPNGM